MSSLKLFASCAVLAGLTACASPLSEPSSARRICDWGSAKRLYDAPWHELSNQQLYEEIQLVCGRVMVGFKEAGAVRGVDPFGRSLTSPETVTRMKTYLTELGFTITWASIDLPHLSGTIPVNRDVVFEVRSHPNVDYLEPSFPGTWNR